MIEVAVTELRRDEIALAGSLLGRAYRDNPLTFALLANDADLRLRVGAEIHRLRIASMQPPPLAARRGVALVGVCGFDPPSGSRMSADDQRRLLETLSQGGPDVLRKAQRMVSEFERRAPKGRYWHLGPVGVAPDLQGLGIGSLMAERFCARMDAQGEPAYLETDQEKNVRLYEKFGFATVDEALVLGVRMWFMVREPAARQ